jgi:dTDP-glucose 4,6-dehydratase
MIVVTGGAGFIGSNFIHRWLGETDEQVVTLDKLTYAGNLANLRAFQNDPRHHFVHGDIGDREAVAEVLAQYRPRAVINFAAESHVDRSIHGPAAFIVTNVDGTFGLLESVREHWSTLDDEARTRFRLLHVSTDEVYGTLGPHDPAFTESHPYRPNSPYAASKAASDHLVRAWHHTYGLPVITTNCSNNYGPYHFPEKLIPLVIHRALAGESLPVYGDGLQIRDWLYVDDHCRAIMQVLDAGRIGATYNVGGANERTNLDVVRMICELLDELRPRRDGASYQRQITFVQDRPGHDRRYAVDSTRIREELGWRPRETLESGLRKTVTWYLENAEWTDGVVSGAYRSWIDLHYVGSARHPADG